MKITLMDMLENGWYFVKTRGGCCYHGMVNFNFPARGWLQITQAIRKNDDVWEKCCKVWVHESELASIEKENGECVWLR